MVGGGRNVSSRHAALLPDVHETNAAGISHHGKQRSWVVINFEAVQPTSPNSA